MQNSTPSHFRAYPVLALITVILIVWHKFGMQTRLQVFPHPSASVKSFTDDINGGVSTADLSSDDLSVDLHCDIVAVTYTHAFCGAEITLADPIDVTRYDAVNIAITTTTSTRDTTLVYLVNTEPASGTAPKERANMRTVFIDAETSRLALPLESFAVPSWWLLDNPTDSLKGQPNLDSVLKLRLTSGDSTVSRTKRLQIGSIEFEGKLIATNTLYAGLLSCWVLLSLYYALMLFKRLQSESSDMKRRSRRLESVNRFLKLEKSKYQKLAVTDPLTGALNREGISTIIKKALSVWASAKTPSVLILMDIDNFKRLNDQHGHDVGDCVLQEFVQLVQNNIRETDSLARWGGEEFVVISQGSTLENAESLAHKLCSAIAQHSFSAKGVTCSFGLSRIQTDIEGWFKSADEALYQAKRNGRNQVVVCR